MMWREKLNEAGVVVIIPTYNNAGTLGQVIRDVLVYADQVMVVNDGSTDGTLQVLEHFPEIRQITYPENRGKGYALKAGLKAAAVAGFRYALTVDADGQHDAGDIPVFIRAVEEHPGALLIGARRLVSGNIPGKNTFANRFSNFWFRVETGIRLTDTQSGFRLYPLKELQGIRLYTSKYEFELEIIVRAAWRRIPVVNVPVRVYYPPEEERVSHFRPFRDFSRISVLNTVLVLVAFFWYWPLSFFRSLTRESIRRFIRENLTHSGESNMKITLSVMLGIFMGITPFWGYQMITAAVLAHFLRLNKVIAVVTANISIPPMIPFLLYGSYVTGGLILGRPSTLRLEDVTFEILKSGLWQYVVGSFVFGASCSLFAGLVTRIVLSFRKKDKSEIIRNGRHDE